MCLHKGKCRLWLDDACACMICGGGLSVSVSDTWVHVLYVLERKVPLRLNYSKYCNAISQDNLIRLGALLIDYSTREGILAMRTIVLENPEIKIKVCCHDTCFPHKKEIREDGDNCLQLL